MRTKKQVTLRLDDLVRLAEHPEGCRHRRSRSRLSLRLAARRQRSVKVFSFTSKPHRRTQLPLVIHARSADDDMAETLEQETEKGTLSVHSPLFFFRRALAEKGLNWRLYFLPAF